MIPWITNNCFAQEINLKKTFLFTIIIYPCLAYWKYGIHYQLLIFFINPIKFKQTADWSLQLWLNRQDCVIIVL